VRLFGEMVSTGSGVSPVGVSSHWLVVGLRFHSEAVCGGFGSVVVCS